MLQFHGKTPLKAINMSQRDLSISFLLINKTNKADQRKRKAKKKKASPVSRKDTIKGIRHGPKRSGDELPFDQQNEKSLSKKKKSNEKEKDCSNFMERQH